MKELLLQGLGSLQDFYHKTRSQDQFLVRFFGGIRALPNGKTEQDLSHNGKKQMLGHC